MTLSFSTRKQAFVNAGEKLSRVLQADNSTSLSVAEKALYDEMKLSDTKNPWFTAENVRKAFEGIAHMLNPVVLESWLRGYPDLDTPNPKTVAVIMAGNIPFVGFHDMMCVLLSGHRFLGKLSSQDKHLPVKFAGLLFEAEPALEKMTIFAESIIKGFDAVIATGSNNTARYFDYYFGKYPHIIRKNRNSLAVLSGKESDKELEGLADDVFQYFGMGCRNVSKIMVPVDFDLVHLIESFHKWEKLKDHSKFYNNYEYQKAIMLVNRIPHLDTGFSLLLKDTSLVSPLSVLHYSRYKSPEEVVGFIDANHERIQCIVAPGDIVQKNANVVLPGQTQFPAPHEYADGVDTLAFLGEL